jgi:hypothetical protein
MGWWSITENLVNGDAPADIMEKAVTEIAEAYEEEHDRRPYLEELAATLLFVAQGDYEVKGESPDHGPGLGYITDALLKKEALHGTADQDCESSAAGS